MSNWLTSTFQSVREKSLDAVEFVRKDLVDFTSTVKNDTENYLNKVGNFGVHRFVSRLSQKERSGNEKQLVALTPFDRLQNERLRLQNDESTYLVDPTPAEAYQTWRETSQFNLEDRKGDIAQLLIDTPHVRSIYARLVPACTTHNDFWSRYYFRMHQLNEDETRRINLLKRAEEICNEIPGNDWEDPGDEWSDQTLTSKKDENIDLVSSDSWEREEFDATDLPTSKTNPTSSITTDPSEEEWESWS